MNGSHKMDIMNKFLEKNTIQVFLFHLDYGLTTCSDKLEHVTHCGKQAIKKIKRRFIFAYPQPRTAPRFYCFF